MLHPRDYMGKFTIKWKPQAFLSIIRQDLAYINPQTAPADWTLSKLLHSEPRCARWSAIWWLLIPYQPVPSWVWQDAAWILFKADGALANPVPTNEHHYQLKKRSLRILWGFFRTELSGP